MAFDRKTGRQVYSTPLRIYAWSSPVSFTDPNGKLWVVTGDCAGNLYLIDGRTGEIKTRRNVGNNFESSATVSLSVHAAQQYIKYQSINRQ